MIRDESPFPCMYVYLVGAHTRERGRISFDVEYPYFLRFRQYRSYNGANSACIHMNPEQSKFQTEL